VGRWINRWNAYWFPASTTLDLSVCRIVAVAVHLIWFLPWFGNLGGQIALLENNPEFIHPQLLIRVIAASVSREAFFTPHVFTALYWLTMLAGITALVGLFTRTSLFVLALGTWILIAHKYSYYDVHHQEALFAIFLMLLAFAPSGESLSIDAVIRRGRGRQATPSATGPEIVETAMWPLKLAHVLLAMTYFSTGFAKVLSGGLAWMNGYTLQSYTFQDAIVRKIPLGIWLAQQHELAVALSVFTILFEVFFFVSLILPRTAPLFFITGVFFHIGLFATGGYPFFPHVLLLLLLLVFLDPEWWRPKVNRYLASYHPRWRREEQGHQLL
jgi:hypothetical protein